LLARRQRTVDQRNPPAIAAKPVEEKAMKTHWGGIATAVLAASCLLMTASMAKAEDDVRLRLNRICYGSHAGFALGKDKGIYEEAGIDLDIRSGNGSTSAHRLVANGDSDFAYGSCAAMVTLAAQGAPLISVGVIDAAGTEAVIVRPDAGIASIQDLKGNKILTTANAGVNTFFPMAHLPKTPAMTEAGR
jgi:NitT/TauT family transport system substrate-binding protein